MRQPTLALLALVALAACAPMAPMGPAAPASPAAATPAPATPAPSTTPSGAAPASALTPPPGSGPTAAQVAGRWYTGSGAEPPAGPLRVELSCGYKVAPTVYEPKEFGRDGWTIGQTGDAVQVSASKAYALGPTGPVPACPAYTLDLTGTYKGGVLTLTGTERLDRRGCEAPTPGPSTAPQASPAATPTPAPAETAMPVALTLTYDAASQHLRGTRDGQPFWAVPLQVIDPPPSCGPVAMP